MPHQTHPLLAPHNAWLLLEDGSVFAGYGIGATGTIQGELCFNTAMTGYQEIMTDLSYAGQIVTFTFPHIGNTGTNDEDTESSAPAAKGLVVREAITEPSNYRNQQHFNEWLIKHNITGISGIDTRALTTHLREHGAKRSLIFFTEDGRQPDLDALHSQLKKQPSMKGQELAKANSCTDIHEWNEGLWDLENGYSLGNSNAPFHVVAVDYGLKRNIARNLVSAGCKVTIVPAATSADIILAYNPDGVFLSNGPGDPAATAVYALPIINALLKSGVPIFGICLGHQLLATALGASTEKMQRGHRGANHPVQNLHTGSVEITSQNHGFTVSKDSLPNDMELTHISLFDKTVQGIAHKTKPVFSVQGHPEASPGPHDSHYLFARFVDNMKRHQANNKKTA